MKELSVNIKHSMRVRVITGIVMGVVALPVILLGGWYYFIAGLFLAAVAIHEFISAPNKGRFNIFIYIVVYVCTLSFIFWQFIKDQDVFNSIINNNLFILNDIRISTLGIAVYFVLLFSIILVLERFTVNDASYLFTMGIYIGLAFLCLYYIRFLPNKLEFYGKEGIASSLLLIYVILGTIFNDIGAYFVGVLFGKHKMAPKISPKKTWEGVFGGVVISVGISLLFAFVCGKLGYALLPGVLEFTGTHWIWLLVISAIIPIAADFGDLFFSAIKRSFAIKDFGKIFPGHGGVLDRFDSITFVCIIVGIMVFFIANGWKFL